MKKRFPVQWLVGCTVATLAGTIAAGRADNAARAQAGKPPTVSTRSASALGTTGMTINGSVHSHALPGTFFFEYGPTSRYGSQTEAAPLPPRLSAFYREDWNAGTGGWESWNFAHHAQGGVDGGFVRFSEPSADDPNHVDGIGALHLVKYLYPGVFGPTLYLGGGDPDLRDARLSLSVRGNDWKPNGSELVWWTQSQSNVEIGEAAGWQRANWAYTGFSLNDFLMSGNWEKVEYRLLNDAEQWTYGGNNHQQSNHSRYSYWPIDKAQRHLNVDFFHLLAFVDPQKRPEGSLDFDQFELAYRNYSLLIPSNGGTLAAAPESDVSPATLTDGWRNGLGHTWHSAKKPSAPLEFVYRFKDPVVIETVQLHQNPEWPAKDVEVLVSTDGTTYSQLVKKTVPEKSPKGPNFTLTIDRALAARASHLKVRIRSGYRDEHWGLGEVDIFGRGATMLPEDDIFFVNTDVEGLEPGATYHYRLTAVTSAGTSHGEDRTFTVPADTRPHVITGGASRTTRTSAKIEGRLNPLGKRTHFYFAYGRDGSYGSRSPTTYGGLQITPRTVFAHLADLQPKTTYHYRLVAENETGVSYGEDQSFRTSE
jgi:hypothetical protein